jgi:phosphoglycerate dehydrogenase-like enzyme
MLLVPYEPATRQLVDDRILRAMREDAYLINIARGGVVDEAALIDAQRTRRIAGAALAVTCTTSSSAERSTDPRGSARCPCRATQPQPR